MTRLETALEPFLRVYYPQLAPEDLVVHGDTQLPRRHQFYVQLVASRPAVLILFWETLPAPALVTARLRKLGYFLAERRTRWLREVAFDPDTLWLQRTLSLYERIDLPAT